MIHDCKLLPFLMLAMLLIVGCHQETGSPPPDSNPKGNVGARPDDQEDHGHKPGAHGGIIISLGRDSYHAEAVFEKGGQVRLYTLGKDEARIQEVEVQELSGFVKVVGESEAVPLSFRPAPQQGDTKGKTSVFLAQLPKDLVGKQVAITIPNIRISGERFRLGFTSVAKNHEPEMPAAAVGERAKKLYLQPGGLYTVADIRANGNTTAAQKYRGFRSKHNLRPKSGDRICPVTRTKANAQCIWIVGGKTYQFCCPPCIDEFLTTAKTEPAVIKAPEEYVKK